MNKWIPGWSYESLIMTHNSWQITEGKEQYRGVIYESWRHDDVITTVKDSRFCVGEVAANSQQTAESNIAHKGYHMTRKSCDWIKYWIKGA